MPQNEVIAVDPRAVGEEVRLALNRELPPVPEGVCALCAEPLFPKDREEADKRQRVEQPWALYVRRGGRVDFYAFAHGVCVENEREEEQGDGE